MDGLKLGKIVLLGMVYLFFVIGAVTTAVTIGTIVLSVGGNKFIALATALTIVLGLNTSRFTDSLELWLFPLVVDTETTEEKP